jgi:hypothetical protein
MTGPEHYVLAEKLLTEATQARGEAARDRRIAEAQVHAALAAAAASALSGSGLGVGRVAGRCRYRHGHTRRARLIRGE